MSVLGTANWHRAFSVFTVATVHPNSASLVQDSGSGNPMHTPIGNACVATTIATLETFLPSAALSAIGTIGFSAIGTIGLRAGSGCRIPTSVAHVVARA